MMIYIRNNGDTDGKPGEGRCRLTGQEGGNQPQAFLIKAGMVGSEKRRTEGAASSR